MEPSELEIGAKYRIKDDVKIRVCSTPMKYAGTTVYRERTYHQFYDPVHRLWHWVNPEDVEPV